jgi:hypothetical protein
MGQEMNRGAFLIIALSVLAFSHLFTGIVSAAETVINCRAHDGKPSCCIKNAVF